MSQLISFADWQKWLPAYRHLPVVLKYALAADRPPSWEKAWTWSADGSAVLESGKAGRFSYLACSPQSIISGDAAQAVIVTPGKRGRETLAMPPLPAVKQWMRPFRAPRPEEGLPPFLGGCIGFWGYDVARTLEKLPELAARDLALPDYCFMRFDRLWVVDHQELALYCVVHTSIEAADVRQLHKQYEQATAAAMDMKGSWDELFVPPPGDPAGQRTERYRQLVETVGMAIDPEVMPGVVPSYTKAAFITAVEKIKNYIAAGDVFQVNLSVRQSCKLAGQPEEIYEWLRLLNPSPYMGLLCFPDFRLVSGSPELLVKLVDGTVETRPIAGTRPRGTDEAADRRLADELLGSEKERAEHIMLVDLLRNDLGRVSRYGTVKVDDLMVVERYSHVMHIVSHVRGRLQEEKDAFDVLRAVFPGGTITGAPKIRTMEIIEELEPVRRGPYTGSIGWIDYGGNMEFNITIRTLVEKDGVGHVQAGAGIVIDSVPEREYLESLNKAKALWKAVQLSEDGIR